MLTRSMKVALIVSPYPLEEAPAPPLGLCYAAAAFLAAGAEVRIFDYLVQRYAPEKLCFDLEGFQPDIVGTNSVTMNFYEAAGILQTAKQNFPSVITIMGGPHVSFDFHNTLKQYPEIDIIVIGEGEATIQELLPAIRDRKRWHSIRGVAFSENGEIISTGQRHFIKDLDSLPLPARHLIPLSRYQALGFPVSIITSRGCPNQCIFCQGRRMVGSKVRYRNTVSIVDEIEEILDYGIARVNIADDFFTFNRKRVVAFCSEIKKRNLKFEWSAFARADSANTELMEIMLDAGCDSVLFGIESGNQEILNLIRKRIKLDQIRKAVADCKATGMRIVGTFIIGLPGESHDTLMETHNFAEELGIDYGYHFLAPFPGTIVRENIDQYDLELLTEDYSRFSANQAIVRTSRLSAEEMDRFVDEYYFSRIKAEEDDIEKRFREGKITDFEHLFYMGKQKGEIIYQLFSKDIIEAHGTLPLVSHNSNSQQQLAQKIAAVLDKEPATVESIIRGIITSGYLKSRRENGRVIWYWTHNNKIDRLVFETPK